MAISTLISAEEFEQLSQDSEARLEFMDGEVIELSSPRPSHNFIVANLLQSVDGLSKKNPNGRWLFGSEFRLSENRRVIPDLALILHPKSQLLQVDQTPIELIPDLAIEVISPSETALDVERKVFAYLDAGVEEVWTLYPDLQHIYVYSPGTLSLLKQSDTLKTTILPGWSCPVGEIFSI
jgi:Uma2 family endonuclease